MNKISQLCSICNLNESKYSCPSCKHIKYCTLICYDKHKKETNDHQIVLETSCSTTTESQDIKTKIYNTNSNSNNNKSQTYYKQVTNEQIDLLDKSKYIQSAIDHKELKQLILDIDSIEDEVEKINLLDRYRNTIPEFNQFILKMLATVGTLDNLTINDNGELVPKDSAMN